jgi:hypothetical protein
MLIERFRGSQIEMAEGQHLPEDRRAGQHVLVTLKVCPCMEE